ncbi:hypothetical protein HDE_08447 [Halotydeus destructor]|nr:hypothetical protein HDE_08447 [Halotydeus destructor]
MSVGLSGPFLFKLTTVVVITWATATMASSPSSTGSPKLSATGNHGNGEDTATSIQRPVKQVEGRFFGQPRTFVTTDPQFDSETTVDELFWRRFSNPLAILINPNIRFGLTGFTRLEKRYLHYRPSLWKKLLGLVVGLFRTS